MCAAGWSEEEIMEHIKKAEEREDVTLTEVSSTNTVDQSATVRHLLVVGCGDGGSMIASAIRSKVPGTYAICYNTSPRAMEKINADIKMIPDAEDGSGKVRDYSKSVFKQGSYKVLLGNVAAALESRPDIAYILVCATADGGTGSGVSPMIAKILSDNNNIPVMILGVYPNLSEDATAQFNTMVWQDEVFRTNLPYMIFDNNVPGVSNKLQIHDKVNGSIAEMLRVITGDFYGNSNISTIDSRDMWMLLVNTGKRIVIASSQKRPSTGQSLDDYVEQMLEVNNQPMPDNVKGIGILLKGPSEMIRSMDTSLGKIRQTYGDAVVQYTHIEESDEIRISVIMSGCTEPENRLYMIKSRYDDIQNAQREDTSSIASMLGSMSNPLGTLKSTKKESVEPDLSGLDF